MINAFFVLRFKEVKGRWPFMKAKVQNQVPLDESNSGGSVTSGKGNVTSKVVEEK